MWYRNSAKMPININIGIFVSLFKILVADHLLNQFERVQQYHVFYYVEQSQRLVEALINGLEDFTSHRMTTTP